MSGGTSVSEGGVQRVSHSVHDRRTPTAPAAASTTRRPTSPVVNLSKQQSVPAQPPVATIVGGESPLYEEVINYCRAKDKDTVHCVMCGMSPGKHCTIPGQNKVGRKTVDECIAFCCVFFPSSPHVLPVNAFMNTGLHTRRTCARSATGTRGCRWRRVCTSSGAKAARSSCGCSPSARSLTLRNATDAERGAGSAT